MPVSGSGFSRLDQPNRVYDHLEHGLMGDELLWSGRVRSRLPQHAFDSDRLIAPQRKVQRRLTAAEQLQVNSGEEVAVDLGPMFRTQGQIDVEPAAQRVETGSRARKPHARQSQRIRKGAADRITPQASELPIQERQVEI